MTLQELIEIKNGEYVEVAGSANAINQCVDLANLYLREVCSHLIVEWTNACDFPSKIKDMDWIPNDEITDLPKEGDIIIWSNKVGGGAGHIAIFLEGATSSFRSFDQNYPLSSPCHVQGHTYSNVLGWLRPKLPVQDNMTEAEQQILKFIRENKITEGQVRQGYGYITDNVDKKLSDLEKLAYDNLEKLKAMTEKYEQERRTAVGWQNSALIANADLKRINAELLQATNLTAWDHLKLGIELLIKKSK